MTDKVDINALGSHFDEVLKSHQEKHVNNTVAETTRKRNAELLKHRLINVLRSKKLRRSSNTEFYSIPDVDSGTDVSFRLSTVGTTLPEAVIKMVEPYGDFYKEYLRDGALYQTKGPKTVDKLTKELLIRERISIYANLETSDGQTTTRDEVYVCTILDPASILIPETDTKFVKIGPEDPKFISFFTALSLVNDRVGGRKKRIQKLKLLPLFAAIKKSKKQKVKPSKVSAAKVAKAQKKHTHKLESNIKAATPKKRKNRLTRNQKITRTLQFAVPIVVVALLVGAGWVTYQKLSKKSYFSTTSVSKNISESTEKRYVGWKEYCTSAGGICLKYPKEWNMSEVAEPTRASQTLQKVDITSPSGSTTVEYQPICPQPAISPGQYTDNILSVTTPSYSNSYRVVESISTYSPINSRTITTQDSLYLTSATLAQKDDITVGNHSGATSLANEKVNMYFKNIFAASPNITQCLYVKSTASQFNSQDTAQEWFSTPDAQNAESILNSTL